MLRRHRRGDGRPADHVAHARRRRRQAAAPTCRCRPRTTRSSGCAGCGSACRHRDAVRRPARGDLRGPRAALRSSVMFPMVSLGRRADRGARGPAARGGAGPAGSRPTCEWGSWSRCRRPRSRWRRFAPYVDFVSIGTNDLTQYALAAERGNAGVAALSDALDPGVLQLVAATCRAAEGHALGVGLRRGRLRPASPCRCSSGWGCASSASRLPPCPRSRRRSARSTWSVPVTGRTSPGSKGQCSSTPARG